VNRPVHFEILADDPLKVAQFYKAVFGWEIETQSAGEAHWHVTTGPAGVRGINGAIMRHHFPQGVINTTEVPSLDDAIAKVEAVGGRKVQGPNVLPGVGISAYCADPEDNIFGLLQPAARRP
jgi:uncharacterized protein